MASAVPLFRSSFTWARAISRSWSEGVPYMLPGQTECQVEPPEMALARYLEMVKEQEKFAELRYDDLRVLFLTKVRLLLG
jgi:hypothetical protein